MLDKLQGRNGTGEFARRSMKNLDFVLMAGASGEDVHPVTQTIAALLGIVVFPWESNAFSVIKKLRLPLAQGKGWPEWNMSGRRIEANRVKNIGDLVELLRNSIAHGHVTFNSDSKELKDITVTFENYPEGNDQVDWRADIRADHLATFCRKFSQCVADHTS